MHGHGVDHIVVVTRFRMGYCLSAADPCVVEGLHRKKETVCMTERNQRIEGMNELMHELMHE